MYSNDATRTSRIKAIEMRYVADIAPCVKQMSGLELQSGPGAGSVGRCPA